MSGKLEIVDDDMARILRGMTGAERLRIADRMFSSARRMIASLLAAEHPDWDPERIERETSTRIMSGEPVECVYLKDWSARFGLEEIFFASEPES